MMFAFANIQNSGFSGFDSLNETGVSSQGSSSKYKPSRDNTCWLIHLEKPLDETKGKTFVKSLLLNEQEERGAYWIKDYKEAVNAFIDIE